MCVCSILCGPSRERAVVQIKGLLEVPLKSGDQMLCSLQLQEKSKKSIFCSSSEGYAVVKKSSS
jgi:hypothetical protein